MPNEKYYTPNWPFRILLEHCSIQKNVFDPSAGDGENMRYLMSLGYNTYQSDLEPDHFEVDRYDFLSNTRDIELVNKQGVKVIDKFHPFTSYDIVTNPPYGVKNELAVAFINKSLQLANLQQPLTHIRNPAKVAMLLSDQFDGAKGRTNLFRDNPFYWGKIILLERIRWRNVEQKSSPIKRHAWYIWDMSKPYQPCTHCSTLPIIKYGV